MNNYNTSNYIMPINNELIDEAKDLLNESIPSNSDDKYELYKKIDNIFKRILEYRNEYIDGIVNTVLLKNSLVLSSVTITLCPEIEDVVHSLLTKQVEIYKSDR